MSLLDMEHLKAYVIVSSLCNPAISAVPGELVMQYSFEPLKLRLNLVELGEKPATTSVISYSSNWTRSYRSLRWCAEIMQL
jgi:hypothetical protein